MEEVGKKPTREELENILHQVSMQDKKLLEENKKLKEIVNNLNLTNLFKRLDYLFTIIDKDSEYFTKEFKRKCAEEVEEILFEEEHTEETSQE